MEVILWVVGIIVALWFWGWLSEISKKANQHDYLKSQIARLISSEKQLKTTIFDLQNKEINSLASLESLKIQFESEIKQDKDTLQTELSKMQLVINDLQRKTKYERDSVQRIYDEKAQGFPWLAKAYEEFWSLQDGKVADEWQYKKRPALKAADAIRQISSERRNAEKAALVSNYLLGYCRFLAPWLDDYIGINAEELDSLITGIHESWSKTEDVFNDEVKKYFGPNYDFLPQCEKLQKKLDFYWNNPSKSDWQIGKDYERYVGYLYEQDGYQVQYHGLKGFEDLGRDLICKKDDITEIVQCKRWAQGKEIHEKHIYYLFGTAIEFYLSNIADDGSPVEFDVHKFKNLIKPKLIATVDISKKANQVARILGVEIEKHQFNNFPSIKCNISQADGSKIYHLPFDQQYDTTRIEEERLEYRVSTIKEAERLGFRHAFRWHGDLKED